MAGTNLWLVCGQSATTATRLKPFYYCLDSSPEKPTNNDPSLLCGLGWKNSVLHNSSFKPRLRKSFVQFRRCRCGGDSINAENNSAVDSCSSSSLEWDWNKWSCHFAEVDLAENYASALKCQLEEAIEKNDFQEASKLKKDIAEATSVCCVGEIMAEFKNAVAQERYLDASRLAKDSGSELVGWWVGYSENPIGRIVRITPGIGRFVAKSYTPSQLVEASPGSPLFEIFVVKDAAHERYMMQVVSVRAKAGSAGYNISPFKDEEEPQASELGTSGGDVEQNEVEGETIDEKSMNIEGATDEGVESIMNFFKDEFPVVKVKVTDFNDTGGVSENNDSMEQLIQDEAEKTMSNNDEDMPSKVHIRIPAEIKDVEKDSFVLHIPGQLLDTEDADSMQWRSKLAALTASSVYELMSSDQIKIVRAPEGSKGYTNMREIIKLGFSQAQKKSRLCEEYTNFSRITTASDNLDPFDGVYVGDFHPLGLEIVQLRRKYGHWNNGEDSSDTDFCEYVEAVKLTGDVNVPAGQVAFRARIGSINLRKYRGEHADGGIRIPAGVSSYKGEGRKAKIGFKNPKWVEGELLMLNGKVNKIPIPHFERAELGFLYIGPKERNLVLLKRLTLPE
ncbi:Protein EXECUTER 2, chloroplastic [Linum perenne]